MKRLLLLIFLAALSFPCNASHGQQTVAESDGYRPYSLDSPWNLPIGANPAYDVKSDSYIRRLAKSGHFGCDPTQYTLPVYIINAETPIHKVRVAESFSEVSGNHGNYLEVHRNVTVDVPIPDLAAPAVGSDAQIILWNPDTGDEWGFWLFNEEPGHRFAARNGYYYNSRANGVPPLGFKSRGAGLPYLAGLIRPWEIRQGRIEHALAFANEHPGRRHVYPATKSDGDAAFPELPMGARLQLDPALGEKEFSEWGLDQTGVIIARALQEYGMILIDGSGHPKLYAEYEGTAHWGEVLDPNAVRSIPYTAFRVLNLEQAPPSQKPEGLQVSQKDGALRLAWNWNMAGGDTFRIIRRVQGQASFILLESGIADLSYLDTSLEPGTSYEYGVQAVNWNGVGPAEIIGITVP